MLNNNKNYLNNILQVREISNLLVSDGPFDAG